MVTSLVAGDGVEDRPVAAIVKLCGEIGVVVNAGAGHTHGEEGKP